MNDKVDFDKYTDNYNDLLREGTQFFSANEEYFAKYKIELVSNRMRGNTPTRVLEYGCGIGRNIPYLQQAFPGAEIVGTDISAASLEVAAQHNPDVRFEVEHEGLDLGKFELIFIAGVFHHIPPSERASAAAGVARRLTPGGSVYVFEHNPFNPVTRRIVNTCPYDADAVLLRPSELKRWLSEAGMTTKESGYCLFIPPRLLSLRPLEKHLAWLPLGGQYWVSAEAGG
jgi:SAM-dependent methyltransferase